MSALPVQPRTQRAEGPPARGGRKPVQSSNSPRSKQAATDKRSFAGKRFVGFETDFLAAVRRHASSLSELRLILFVAELADQREVGNPFGRTAAIMPSALAEELGCTTQNVNCSASTWFYDRAAAESGEPTGLIERFERKGRKATEIRKVDGDSRAFELQIRADYVETWAKQREEARRRAEQLKREQEAARKAALEAPQEEEESEPGAPLPAYRRRRSWKSAAPVRVSPKTPFKLPDAAREVIQENCTAIAATREGTITELRMTSKGVLLFDFDPAPASPVEPEIDKSTCRSQPPKAPHQKPPIDKSTCGSPNSVVANKQLAKRDSRRYDAIPDDSAEPVNPALTDLRRKLDRKLLEQIGAPVDRRVFGEIVAQLGGAEAITQPLTAALLAAVKASGAKIRSWKFLVNPSPKTGKSIVETVRIAEQRKAEIGTDEAECRSENTDEDYSPAAYFERMAKQSVADRRAKDAGGKDGH